MSELPSRTLAQYPIERCSPESVFILFYAVNLAPRITSIVREESGLIRDLLYIYPEGEDIGTVVFTCRDLDQETESLVYISLNAAGNALIMRDKESRVLEGSYIVVEFYKLVEYLQDPYMLILAD